MLEEMIGDDEVNRLRFDRRQQLAVVDYVDGRQILTIELGVMRPQFGEGHPIDVADADPRGQHHR